MKNKILIPSLIVLALAVFFSFRYAKGSDGLSSEAEQKAIMQTTLAVINKNHYAPKDINDNFSHAVFDKLIEGLDIEKKFFLRHDIENLSTKHRHLIDDQVKANSLDFFNDVNQLFVNSIEQTESYYKKILSHAFSFDGEESVILDGRKIDFPASEEEREKRWEAILKQRVLARYLDLKKTEEQKTKDSINYQAKDFVSLEKEARESILKVQERYFKRLKRFNDNDRFAIYMNSVSSAFDPHTNYMQPQDRKRFDEMMSGSFIGIGASLQITDEGKVKVASIITGSPSWKQGKLKEEDIIEKVAEGDEEPIEVEGFELEDVVKMIRGKKGTEVRLTVTHKDGTSEIIPIIRGKVDFDDLFAKSAIIENNGNKIGYIYLPEFYSDFSGQNGGRRSSTDVAKEVEKLKSENVDGIVLDLRNNGGGSLGDVVDMVGLFVGKGPVVQVRASGNQTMTLSSKSQQPTYEGPLAIMINSGSASASEILAAAMQDYGRAVVVGSNSFGKGTVQKLVYLDQVVRESVRQQIIEAFNKAKGDGASYDGIGTLKLTIQKFYRINGGSTQVKGVSPDITLPDAYEMLDDIGEKRHESSLPWDKIAGVDYNAWNVPPPMASLVSNSRKRVSKNEAFELIRRTGKRLKTQQDNYEISLNEVKYAERLKEAEEIGKRLEELEKIESPIIVKNLSADLGKVNLDETSQTKNEEWLNNLKKDVYISETTNIINDWIATKGKQSKLRRGIINN